MKENLKDSVNFEIIRYANCWEDADILLEGLEPEQGSKILSIGSAGDNSFSLLASNPSIVVAVDVNRIQLHLIELKKAAIKLLDIEEIIPFLGFSQSDNRVKVFNSIKNEITIAAKNYWEQNLYIIEQGVINAGKFENYFKLFSTKILPFIHSTETIKELFRAKTSEEQKHFYNTKWNTWRWRMLFKVFFSKYIMGKFGRDPQFLKQVNLPVSDYIFKKAELQLQDIKAQNNLFLHYNLTGNFGSFLPNYLQKQNYERIKANIDRLQVFEGYAQEAISKFGKFNCMNLSNIFEYMEDEIFAKTAEALIDGTEKDGKLAYWNLMVPHRVSTVCPQKLTYEKDKSLALTAKDKGFFYNQFLVDTVL